MRHARAVSVSTAPQPSGPYSQAVIAPPFVFLAGQAPLDPATGLVVEGDVETEARAVMRNLTAVANGAGCALADAVRFGVYLRDLADAPIVNRVFVDFLIPPYPARTTIQSSLLRFRVEIDCILYAPGSS